MSRKIYNWSYFNNTTSCASWRINEEILNFSQSTSMNLQQTKCVESPSGVLVVTRNFRTPCVHSPVSKNLFPRKRDLALNFIFLTFTGTCTAVYSREPATKENRLSRFYEVESSKKNCSPNLWKPSLNFRRCPKRAIIQRTRPNPLCGVLQPGRIF